MKGKTMRRIKTRKLARPAHITSTVVSRRLGTRMIETPEDARKIGSQMAKEVAKKLTLRLTA